MADVFISYARKDNLDGFVAKLFDQLEANKVDAWMDKKDIPPAFDFLKEMYPAIEEADFFLFVVTPNSIESEYCRQELEQATKLNKRLIPIIRRETEVEHVPAALTHLNWLWFRETDDFAVAFQSLLAAIRTADQAYVHFHTRLLVRAREWDASGHNTGFLLRGKSLQEAEAWLIKGVNEEPRPTVLQSQYIAASRQATNAFQRVMLAAVTGGFVVVSILAILTFLARQQAVTNERVAIANADTATIAQGQALYNASTATMAQGQAQNNALTAVANAATATVAQGQALQYAATAVANANTATVAQGQAFDNAATAVIAQGQAQNNAATAVANAATATVAQGQAQQNAATAVIAQGQAQNNAATAVANAATATVAQGQAQQNAAIATIAQGQAQNNAATAVANAATATVAQGQAQQNAATATIAQGQAQNNAATAVANAATATVAQGQAINNAATATYLQGQAEQEAQRQANIALSRQLAAQALYRRPDNFDPAQLQIPLLLSLEANRIADTTEAHQSLLEAVKQFPDFNVTLLTRQNAITSLAFSPDGKLLAIGMANGSIQIMDSQTRQPLGSPFRIYKTAIIGLSFDGNNQFLISAAENDPIVYMWQVSAWNAGHDHFEFFGKEPVHGAGAFNSDGTLAVFPLSEDSGGGLIIWDFTSSYPDSIGRYNNNRHVYSFVIFSPDGQTLAAVTKNTDIELWRFDTSEYVLEPEVNLRSTIHATAPIISLAFSSDGKQLISSDDGDAITFWDSATGNRIGQPLKGYSVKAMSIVFGGNILASASADGRVILWDPTTHLPLDQLLTNNRGVFSLAFTNQPTSIGTQTLAVGSPDGSLTLWNLDMNYWKEFACQHVTRNLTQDEWLQFIGTQPYRETCALTSSPTPTATP